MQRKSLWSALLLCVTVDAQASGHLWWDLAGQRKATDLYGEITVLASAPAIYFAGANWHPGEPAGGYCGIQNNTATEKRTIFSIWDTTATLHPTVTHADARTETHRFGGEGEGGHTHMIWPWNVGDTFQFYVHKQPAKGDTTDTKYYVYDRVAKRWLHSATINNPNGGKPSVATIGGSLASFLENYAPKAKRDVDTPKLALYRLWLGNDLEHMRSLTQAEGDGTWGQLHGQFFLGEGDTAKLQALFDRLKGKYGAATMGIEGKRLKPTTDVAISKATIEELKKVPEAPPLAAQ